MTSEFHLAMEALGFGPDDFKTIFQNALAARFERKLRHDPSWRALGNEEP